MKRHRDGSGSFELGDRLYIPMIDLHRVPDRSLTGPQIEVEVRLYEYEFVDTGGKLELIRTCKTFGARRAIPAGDISRVPEDYFKTACREVAMQMVDRFFEDEWEKHFEGKFAEKVKELTGDE